MTEPDPNDTAESRRRLAGPAYHSEAVDDAGPDSSAKPMPSPYVENGDLTDTKRRRWQWIGLAIEAISDIW